MKKKGDIFQILYLLIILFLISTIGLIFYTLSYRVTQTQEDTGILNGTAIGEQPREINKKIQTTAKYTTQEFVVLFFLGMVIALVISAVRTNFSPVVIFLFILVLIMSILVASGLTNIYQGLAETEALSETAIQLTWNNIIWSQYTPLIICILGAVIMIIMYGKSGGDIVR